MLEPDRLVAKIVGGGGRGGFCYEVNGALALLLEALGYRVTRLEGRSIMDGRLGIRFDHLCLRVDLDEPHLVDVGFGACFDEPLRLVTDVDQVDPDGTFRITETDDGWLEVTNHGEPEYRFSPEPRSLVDFTPGCEHHQTSPESHFTKNPVCTLRTPDGRVTAAGPQAPGHDGGPEGGAGGGDRRAGRPLRRALRHPAVRRGGRPARLTARLRPCAPRPPSSSASTCRSSPSATAATSSPR